MPQNSVHALLQSKDGYLWLATENGVARFNGLRFQHYSSANEPAFASDDVCCIAEATPGRVLFGTASGVVMLQDGGFSLVPGITGEVLSLQRESDGDVLVLTTAGLQRLHGESVSTVTLAGGALPGAMGPAADGSALVVAGTDLFRVLGTEIQRKGPLPRGILQIAEDAAHQIWTADASVVELRDARLQVLRQWQVGRELPGSRLESLRLWPGGALAGTNRGAAVLRSRDGVAEPVAFVANNAVLSALMDREGDAWFGTDSSGLFGLRERSIGSSAALAGESVTALAAAADGTLWAGTRDAGLRMLRPGGTTDQPAPQRLASDVILSLVAGATDVWVGSPEGLDHIQGVHVEHMTAADGLPDDFIRSLLIARGGTVWAGTRRGVAELRDRRVERVLTVSDGLPSDVIGALLQDRDGSVWIGTVAGLARWDGKALLRIGPVNRAAVAVASLFQTEAGTLWVGTGQGLFLLSGKRLLALNQPALRGSIAAVLADGAGNLWVRTAAGLLRASETSLRACAGQTTCGVSVRQFGVADGMPSVELPTLGYPVATRNREGMLWFATRRGLAFVNARQSEPNAVPPGIAVEEVRVDDSPAQLRSEIRVGAGRRRIAIGFAGLSLRAPAQVRFRYLLAGFDRDWSPWQSGSTAEYTNLPPGRFLFRVQAMNAEGVVSRSDATVTFRVEAPVYRRWWFYALLVLLAAAAGYGIYWLRLRRVRRDFETVLQERNRIAREIHDTLAQDFVAVSLQLEVTSQLLRGGATEAAKEQIDATRTLVREGIQDARESIWAIRAGGSKETLPARLAAVTERVDTAAFLVTGAYRALAPSREREMFRIGKEAFGNARQHAQAGHIQVELIYSEDAVLLRVSDDGAGFDVAAGAAKPGHYGVRGMRERAAAMGATLTVQSAPGQGTCVELRLIDGGKREA
ncbi:sensor histidine kinase [Terriglobus sp.]|uniref:sensor histidine kinase n=1 Tax=Terriglobus sp. TaxID=1889013 RepID=UPI003B008F44